LRVFLFTGKEDSMVDKLIKDLVYRLKIKNPENAIFKLEEGEKKIISETQKLIKSFQVPSKDNQ